MFDAAISQESLYQAYLDARRGKRAGRACFAFERRLGAQIEDLHISLAGGAYLPRPYYSFTVREPKERVIHAPAFRDRVVQHAVYKHLQAAFEPVFIEQNFACRVGKGTHAAANYVQHAMQQVPRDSYFLQLDIRRYYYSLDRTVLRRLIERRIKDRRLVDLVMVFASCEAPLGVPIGNLLSQMFGLIYLNPIDHFIKRVLGVRWYARYVDDFVLIGIDKDRAVAARERIVELLRNDLKLELSKAVLAPVRRGINFVGYRTWASRRFVRKRALYTFRRAAKRGAVDSVVSCLGHALDTASRRHMLMLLKTRHRDLHDLLPAKVC